MSSVFLVPGPLPDARRSWRKTINAVDASRPGGYAVDGEWLEERASYAASRPGTILGVDLGTPVGSVVTVWAVDEDGALAQVWQVARKGIWSGPATIKKLVKLAGKHGSMWQVTQLTAARNAADASCRRCRKLVPAGQGMQRHYGRELDVYHYPACPPVPNQFEGICKECGGWLLPGEGRLAKRHSYRGSWMIRHLDVCPPAAERRPIPEIVNRWPGRCGLCRRLVEAGEGRYVRYEAFDLTDDDVVSVTRGYVRHNRCRRRRRPPLPIPSAPTGGRPRGRRDRQQVGRARSSTVARKTTRLDV